MSGNEHMRAGDADRQRAAEVLRGALDEGRLNFTEYDERVADAYRAVTYADLNELLADLPSQTGAVLPHSSTSAGPSAAAAGADASADGSAGIGATGTHPRESSSMVARQPAAAYGPPLPMPQAAARIEPPAKRRRKRRRRIPLALQILWVILGTAVVINLVVWLIVSVTAGLQYFWPIWVAGPAGAALLGVTVGIDWMRHLHDRDRRVDDD